MAKQTAKEALGESIRQLEIRQAQQEEELKVQFRDTYESLKLVNLVKSSIKDITESAELRTSLFESIVSVLSGYVSQKMIVKSKNNPFMKIVGLAMQFGITNLVSKNAEAIRGYIAQLTGKFLHSKEKE